MIRWHNFSFSCPFRRLVSSSCPRFSLRRNNFYIFWLICRLVQPVNITKYRCCPLNNLGDRFKVISGAINSSVRRECERKRRQAMRRSESQFRRSQQIYLSDRSLNGRNVSLRKREQVKSITKIWCTSSIILHNPFSLKMSISRTHKLLHRRHQHMFGFPMLRLCSGVY